MKARMHRFFPSIWLGEFRTKAEFDALAPRLAEAFSVYDWIDDRLLYSRHSFTYPAYCAACEQVTQMRIDWLFGGWSNVTPSVHPAWTETGVCVRCGLNSRMRALLDFLKTRCNLKKNSERLCCRADYSILPCSETDNSYIGRQRILRA